MENISARMCFCQIDRALFYQIGRLSTYAHAQERPIFYFSYLASKINEIFLLVDLLEVMGDMQKELGSNMHRAPTQYIELYERGANDTVKTAQRK